MRRRPPFELLTLDLDDTLWPCHPPLQQAERAVQEWLATQAPRLAEAYDQEGLRRHRLALMARQPEIAYDMTRVRREALMDLLARLGYDPALAEEAMAVFFAHRNQVAPYADVIPALQGLRARYRLVSVTNGNAQVHNTPLAGLFHHSLTAAGVGAAKPDPAMFRAALDWAGVEPARAVHVGDDPLLDIDAARRLGITTVWIDRFDRPWPAQLDPPDVRVADLDGLLAWLASTTHAL